MSQQQILRVNFPGKLIFGNGVLTTLQQDVKRANFRHVLLLTITPLLEQLSELICELEADGINVQVDTSVVQEPTFSDLNRVVEKYKSETIDLVIGIGGGSVLDVAKLAAAQLKSNQTLPEIVGNGLLKDRKIALYLGPATAGTGSEVSPNAILVDHENQKKGIISPYLVPDAVYVDPSLTLGVPSAITAATGLDAFTHCLEAFTNKFSQPFIDMYAFQGMKLIAENIVRAVTNGDDIQARNQVAMGSLLGGFCLGPVNTAGVHALSYPLGSMFHLPHGLSNALLLPYVMEFNYIASPSKYAQAAIALGCKQELTDELTARAGIQKVRQLIQECGIPTRLREVNIPREAIPKMAEDAMKITRLLVNNPREITLNDALSIFNAAY